MSHLQYTEKGFLVILWTCLFGVEVTLTQEGPPYFFYQQSEYPRDCKEAIYQCSSDNSNGVYIVKPDGYLQPFEVYCYNDNSSSGWTVIQRQIDGFLTFNRHWDCFKSGFGFLQGDFWIGLDKLSYLTNQAEYELRVDIVLFNGSSFYVSYNSFRISDEWGDYTIVSAEGFRSNWSCIVSVCPYNMTHDSCTCQTLCTDPIGQTDCYTDCVEACVPEGCLVSETSSFLLNGESFITADCSQNCTCIDNQLNCYSGYECSTDATCTVKDEIRKCYCDEGFEENGETCIRNSFRDCYDAYQDGHTTDGVYTILPTGWTGSPFTVFCDMTTDGGGWTVFQRRTDGVTDFYRTWNEYQQGFGSRDAGNDFWLGNEKIYYLTNQKVNKLRVDIVTSGGSSEYAEYSTFEIGDVSAKYQLSIGSYSGNAGNGLVLDNGGQFSTRDEDNDGCRYHDFAEGHKGGWWYTTIVYPSYCTDCWRGSIYCHFFQTRSGCYNRCTWSNLNGAYSGGNGKNIFWDANDNCNLNSAEMKIRPAVIN